MLFSEFSGYFWGFIGGISIFVWVEASARLTTGTAVAPLQQLSTSWTDGVDGAAASAAPERVASNLRWGGASRSIGGR